MTRQAYRTSSLITVSSSVALTDILSFVVPGRMLGVNRVLHGRLFGDYLSNGTGTSSLQFQAIYGATTMWDDTTALNAIDADVRTVAFDFWLYNLGVTNSQRFSGRLLMSNANSATAGYGDIGSGQTGAWPVAGTASEDSTAAKTFSIKVAHSQNHANVRFRRFFAMAEID